MLGLMHRIRFAGVIAVVAATPFLGCSEVPKEPVRNSAESTRDSILALLSNEARAITDRAIAETSSRAAWEAVREQRRSELRDMLGLAPDRARTPLNVQQLGVIERDGYVIEKIAFESMPKIYVTANLYLPVGQDGPVPAVIYVCGHAYSPHGAKTSYQRHGHTLARHGYAAMVIDPVQIAETAGLHHGVYNQEMYEWYTRGYSPAGLEVWNAIRALDYLETREEIDSDRFAMTGRSGGAAMTWFTAAVEPRIKVAIPIMGISTYAASVPENTQRLHCDCMFPVNFHKHDLLHLGALIAPRPLLTAHGRTDALFPVEGYEEFEAAISVLYESYDVAGKFRNTVVESGHEDSDFLRAEAVRWLDEWLIEREPREIDTAFEEAAPEELAVFGGAPPDNARNYRAHEFFIPSAEPVRWSDSAGWAARRDQLATALRHTALGAVAMDSPAPATRPGTLDAPSGFESISFDYAERVPIESIFKLNSNSSDAALLHVAMPGEDSQSVRQLLRNLSRFGQNPVMVVYPPGTGTATWSKTDWKKLLRNAMHTGSSVDAIRIGSILTAAKVYRDLLGDDREMAVSGIGPAAGWAMYAAAMDDQISQAILIRSPDSHIEGPILLAALRHADLPDVAALIAPRRLTFYGDMGSAYSRARSIYEGLGVSANLNLSMSVGAALNGRYGHGFALGL